MKYGMPRKIDDVRRTRLIAGLLSAAVLVAAAWSGYEAWMAPYRARRAHLAETVREGKEILGRFQDELVVAEGGGKLVIILKWMREYAKAGEQLKKVERKHAGAKTVRPNGVPEGMASAEAADRYRKGRRALLAASQKASTLAEEISGMLEGGAAGKQTRAEARIQDFADALCELERASRLARPSADVAETAETHFLEAYVRAEAAAKQIPEWERVQMEARAITNRWNAAKTEMKNAMEQKR